MAKGRFRPAAHYGEKNAASKFNAGTVRAVRAAYLGGVSMNELATSYGVCLSTIDRIISRRTWSHVA